MLTFLSSREFLTHVTYCSSLVCRRRRTSPGGTYGKTTKNIDMTEWRTTKKIASERNGMDIIQSSKSKVVRKLDLSFTSVSYEISSATSEFSSETESQSESYKSENDSTEREEILLQEKVRREIELLREKEREIEKQIERRAKESVKGKEKGKEMEFRDKRKDKFSLRTLFTPRSRNSVEKALASSDRSPLGARREKSEAAQKEHSGSGSESSSSVDKARRERDKEWERTIDRERERRQRERERARARARQGLTNSAKLY